MSSEQDTQPIFLRVVRIDEGALDPAIKPKQWQFEGLGLA